MPGPMDLEYQNSVLCINFGAGVGGWGVVVGVGVITCITKYIFLFYLAKNYIDSKCKVLFIF